MGLAYNRQSEHLAYNRQSEYLAYNRQRIFSKPEKKKNHWKVQNIIYPHNGQKIFNDYLIFTKKTGEILQVIGKQFEVTRGQMKWKYTVPQNVQKVQGFW